MDTIWVIQISKHLVSPGNRVLKTLTTATKKDGRNIYLPSFKYNTQNIGCDII